jgi:predicted nucleic acid-binding protein
VDRNGYGLSPQDTDRRAKFFEEKLRLLPDCLAVHEEWRKLLVTHSVSGVQVHDARLVAAMRVHGVMRILTFNNKDFARTLTLTPLILAMCLWLRESLRTISWPISMN